ncbi:MAG: hypothetical protein VB048_08235 [Bacteroidaceae bacterium]|nr:hypothetical protein [Bacteroidaceae bacterium]
MEYSSKEKIEKIVITSLIRAEELWENTLEKNKVIASAKETETSIPGHRYLGKDKYKSDCFLAFMLDMRGSTEHLIQAISARTAKVSEMQRVFYEVSALLPAMASIIENTDGAVTEYLGDGLLALFQLPFDNKEKREDVCKISMTVARDCLEALNVAVNPILFARYSLPALKIGIGMSYSQAIITHFGIEPNTQVKVIGRCIYDVSKLSKGENEIAIHEKLEKIYPSGKGGKLSFTRRTFNDIQGYVLNRS